MGWLKRILYGVLIGIASIAPGLSGGTIAIALGFYKNLISAVANLLKDFRKNFLYLFPFGLGAMVSIAAFSVVINYFFVNYALPTNTLFIGFIVGTLPFIWKSFHSNIHDKEAKASHFLVMATFFFIVLIPIFVGDPAHTGSVPPAGASSAFIFLGIGMIAATTLVVPGLSGTMILTSLGYYKPLLAIASSFVTALVSLDIDGAARQLIFIIPLGVGILLGVFLTAKLVNLLFQKVPAYVYAAITGLIIATPIVMLSDTQWGRIDPLHIVISFATLAAGWLLVRKLGDS